VRPRRSAGLQTSIAPLRECASLAVKLRATMKRID
jgi:hypothetical protein